MKDINFLLHEPLLEKFRQMRAYERKIKRAKAKESYKQLDKLKVGMGWMDKEKNGQTGVEKWANRE